VQGATVHANYAEKHFAPAGATIKPYKGQDEANADLAAGRLDYVQADSATLGNFLAGADGACCESLGVVPPDPAIIGPGVGAGIRKEDTALKEKINAAIKAVNNKGILDEITKKFKLDGQLVLPPKG
jgi:polar amino acid transport system substrate-binding protein